MRSFASSFRHYFQKQSLEERTASLDAQTRDDLARDVQESTAAQVDELEQVTDAIERAQLKLAEMQQKKRFIETRLSTYQKKLSTRGKQLERDEERLVGTCMGVSDEATTTRAVKEEETRPLAARLRRHGGRSAGVIVDVEDVESSEEEEDGAGDREAIEEEPCQSLEELERRKQVYQRDQEALERVELAQEQMQQNVLQLQKKIFVLERKRELVLEKTGECRDFLVAAAQQQQHDGDTVPLDDVEEGQWEDDAFLNESNHHHLD